MKRYNHTTRTSKTFQIPFAGAFGFKEKAYFTVEGAETPVEVKF
jgi:hypothetical protein